MVVEDSKVKKIGNMELYKDENYVVISLNPNIYPLDIAYSACYIMLDRAFIVLDGDPKKEIIIELRPKDKTKKIDELGREFNNELINYAVYKIQSERNKVVKESIVQRALLKNQEANQEIPQETLENQDANQETLENQETPETGFEDKGFSKIEENLEELEQSSLDDPLGIAIPWGDTGEKAQSEQNNQEANPSDDIIPIDKIKGK